MYMFLFFFFFQAEDGIRDRNVTGVQTCALPISACGTVAVRVPVMKPAEINMAPYNSVAIGGMTGNADRRITDALEEALVNTDRKSTRLNSSHVSISYAVFCLKKKKKKIKHAKKT